MARKDKRTLILVAAEKVFRDKRYHELTLDDVAKAAKVGKGTIYLYFKDKDDLIFQLALHGHDELCESINGYTKQQNISFRMLLINVCTKISEFFLGRHSLFRAIGEHEMRFHALRNKRRDEFNVHRMKLQAAIGEILKRGREQGLIRENIDLGIQANFLLGMMRTRDHSFGDNVNDMPPIELVIDVFTNGFGNKNQGNE